MSFTQREARRLIRKAVGRVPEGENITHLNIMPMMDMMTILLVAFIFQLSTNALDVIAGTVNLPRTETDAPLPQKSWTLVITPTGVVVEGNPIVSVANGDVDPAEKEGGALGIKIPRLSTFLGALHNEEIKKLVNEGKDPSKEPPPELLVVADRTTPYRLLVEVMYSAKQKEAGFKHFRLIVQKNFPVHPPK
ncbi:MAG: biopolymer transporter ExbD [Deltaproteobacteria bacterium]